MLRDENHIVCLRPRRFNQQAFACCLCYVQSPTQHHLHLIWPSSALTEVTSPTHLLNCKPHCVVLAGLKFKALPAPASSVLGPPCLVLPDFLKTPSYFISNKPPSSGGGGPLETWLSWCMHSALGCILNSV